MTNTKSLPEKSRVFDNRSTPSHRFDSDIDSTQPAFPLER